jgi:hypothetical protein
MKRIVKLLILIGLLAGHEKALGQDPDFAQFFSSPLNINPALTGNINGDWRLISNFRNQWLGPANPYITGTASFDTKLNRKVMNMEEGNRWSIGTMLMYDHTMMGIAKNTYASLNLSNSIKLSEGDIINRLGMGLGATYGRKYVDFDRLTFESQFIGNGFNSVLPTGEEALANMKAFISLNGGLLYSRSTEKSNIDIGIASYHINTPRQTFLKDPNQQIAMRKVIHANMEMFLRDYLALMVNATYQRQSTAYYYSAGAGIGYYISDYPLTILNGGLWYWSNNCITPYLGFQKNRFQIGFSYDATVSKLQNAPRRANSFELSLILRGIRPASGFIACPWK